MRCIFWRLAVLHASYRSTRDMLGACNCAIHPKTAAACSFPTFAGVSMKLILLLFVVSAAALQAQELRISDKDALEIGKKIWMNECGGTVEGLTSWNDGEEFPSLGIGHFIWYPEGMEGPFEESFPKLLKFLTEQGAELPVWVETSPDCPWKTKEEFMGDFHDEHLSDLRDFLKDTVALQARFMAMRLEQALPKILATLHEVERDGVRRQFYRVTKTPQGLYALMDYVNFKGEGVNPKERYKGQGWGLLQVLERMKGSEGKAPVEEFITEASFVLTRRVQNSPPERGEARWLEGWKKRLQTYRE